MDWTINRNLATVCLTALISISGYAWGWVGQPGQDPDSHAKAVGTGSSTKPSKTDSAVGTSTIDFTEIPLSAQGSVKSMIKLHRNRLERNKEAYSSHFQTIDRIFRDYGIPVELRYLSVVESNLQSTALSNKGARGPWQIMPTTGRSLGLRVDGVRDERVDLVKSTHAAAKYLKGLHNKMGDWLLVLAAYNGGPGRVEYAMRVAGSRDFWALERYLPLESRNHVRKFIAIHYVLEGKGGLATGAAQRDLAVQVDTSGTVEKVISGKFNSYVMAKALAMDIQRFNSLNPDFDGKVGIGEYRLRLPEDKMTIFDSRKPEIVAESVRFIMQNGSQEMDRNRAQTDIPPAKTR